MRMMYDAKTELIPVSVEGNCMTEEDPITISRSCYRVNFIEL